MKSKKIVFVSLAPNQAAFFQRIGKALEKKGFEVAHICFHEGSLKWLSAQGAVTYNPYRESLAGWEQLKFEVFGIESVAILIGHEKAAYEITDTRHLVEKFKRHLSAMGNILKQFGRGEDVTIIQELGGFTSVLAAYYAARHVGHDHYFIEPSFFKGRCFLTKNSLHAPVINDADMAFPSPELEVRLQEIIETQRVVIPNKDRLHYRTPLNKIIDLGNIRRLFTKIFYKYVKREREEFEHIGGHVFRHLRMQWNSFSLRNIYQTSVGDGFLYYPLHVPADFALTIRSPEFLDQFALIDYLCRITPVERQVVIKEHPALVGAASATRIKKLLNRHDNLKILHPSCNNHLVLRQAAAVVTVNSKSGAEALLYGKPVFVLGDAFYRTSSLVTSVCQLSRLPSMLNALNVKREFQSTNSLKQYLQGVWNKSYPGELYDLADDNISIFAESIQGILGDK